MRSLPQNQSTAVGILDPGTREEESRMRGYLAQFGITEKTALIKVKYLSGGQRMRVALAISLFQKPDVLILDEPTNHLDTDTCRALCKALSTFKGAIIAVSHDENFVNQVIGGNEVVSSNGSVGGGGKRKEESNNVNKGELHVMSQGRVKRYEGTFQQYKTEIRDRVLSGVNDL